MKYCEEYAALLDLYVDGELSPEELDAVQRHLDRCPGCQAYVDAALAIRAAFPGVEDVAVPEGFAQGVMEIIAKDAAKKAAEKAPARSRRPFWKTAAPLAACLALIVFFQASPWQNGDSAARDIAPAEAAAPESAAITMEPQESVLEKSAPAGEERASIPEAAAAEEDAPAVQDSASTPQPYSIMSADTFSAQLTLTASEAGSLLADYAPVEETETSLRYVLTEEAYAALVQALADAGIVPAEGLPPSEGSGGPILVTVTK